MIDLLPWERIYNWLRANAPGTFDQISAPADEIGRWRLAGAAEPFPTIFTPLPAREAVREQARLRQQVYPELEQEPAARCSASPRGASLRSPETGTSVTTRLLASSPVLKSSSVQHRRDNSIGSMGWRSAAVDAASRTDQPTRVLRTCWL